MADRYDFFFRQKVTEGEFDASNNALEQADLGQMLDLGLLGVMQNAVVTEKAGTPDLTVDVSGSAAAHDKLGQRMAWGPIQNVDLSVDENSISTSPPGGQELIVSLFAKFERSLTDPRIDGNSNTVFFNRAESFAFVVRQGAATGAPPATPPALDVEFILLADVRRANPQTQIFNADITGPGGTYTAISNRREAAFSLSAGALAVLEGTPEESDQAILTHINNHITGVANSHPASSLDYAGGAAWHDGVTNPAATIEVQLDKFITDLNATAGGGGSDKLGSGALAGWLGGRARPAGSIWDQLEAVGVDLSAVATTDDGAERIGSEARTGADFNLALGSAASQLQAIIDNVVHAGAHTWNGNQTYDNNANITYVDDMDISFRQDGTLEWYEGTITGANLKMQLDPGSDLFGVWIGGWEGGIDDGTDFTISGQREAGTGFGSVGDSAVILQAQRGRTHSGANDQNNGSPVIIYAGNPGVGATQDPIVGDERGQPGYIRHTFGSNSRPLQKWEFFFKCPADTGGVTNLDISLQDHGFATNPSSRDEVYLVKVHMMGCGQTGADYGSAMVMATVRRDVSAGATAFSVVGAQTQVHSQSVGWATFVPTIQPVGATTLNIRLQHDANAADAKVGAYVEVIQMDEQDF